MAMDVSVRVILRSIYSAVVTLEKQVPWILGLGKRSGANVMKK